MKNKKDLSLSNQGIKISLIRFCTLVVLVLAMTYAEVGVAKTLKLEVETDGFDGLGYWIGTFVQPLTVESDPTSWKLIESTTTTLDVPDQEDVVLVALQKGSLPIFKHISSSTKELSIELQFQKGKSLRGKILSADGFPIENAVISVGRLEGLQSHQIPDETFLYWQGDQHGKYMISGLRTGSYELKVTARTGLSAKPQILQIEKMPLMLRSQICNWRVSISFPVKLLTKKIN